MSRSASDATRFTATGPHAYSKPPPSAASAMPGWPGMKSRTSQTPQSSPGGSGGTQETPKEKVERLRAEARTARIKKSSSPFDRFLSRGRTWADRLHRVAVLSLIAASGMYACVLQRLWCFYGYGMRRLASFANTGLHWNRRRGHSYHIFDVLADQAQSKPTCVVDRQGDAAPDGREDGIHPRDSDDRATHAIGARKGRRAREAVEGGAEEGGIYLQGSPMDVWRAEEGGSGRRRDVECRKGQRCRSRGCEESGNPNPTRGSVGTRSGREAGRIRIKMELDRLGNGPVDGYIHCDDLRLP